MPSKVRLLGRILLPLRAHPLHLPPKQILQIQTLLAHHPLLTQLNLYVLLLTHVLLLAPIQQPIQVEVLLLLQVARKINRPPVMHLLLLIFDYFGIFCVYEQTIILQLQLVFHWWRFENPVVRLKQQPGLRGFLIFG